MSSMDMAIASEVEDHTESIAVLHQRECMLDVVEREAVRDEAVERKSSCVNPKSRSGFDEP